MPIQTYEAILENISTRIYLYRIALGGVYNSHSVSTLANESFFSDVNRMDKNSGASYLKAVIGKVVTVNYFKHKRYELVNNLN